MYFVLAMAQHFFNCVPPMTSAMFGSSSGGGAWQRLSNYNLSFIQFLRPGISTNSRKYQRKPFFWTAVIVDLWQCSHTSISKSDFNNCRRGPGQVSRIWGHIGKVRLSASSGLPVFPTLPSWDTVHIDEVLSQMLVKHFFGSMRQTF